MKIKKGIPKHPIQPLIVAEDGVHRFKPNKIVQFLLDSARAGAKNDLNSLACMDFSNDDWTQFAQLIGYSFSGWGTLSYVSNKAWNKASRRDVYDNKKE